MPVFWKFIFPDDIEVWSLELCKEGIKFLVLFGCYFFVNFQHIVD